MTCVGNRNREGRGRNKEKERSDLADRLTAKHPDNTAATQECQAPPAPSVGSWGQGTPRGAGTHQTQPHAPTWLAQKAQTGQTSLEGDSRTANARPTPRGRRQAWLRHPVVARDNHQASQGPPPAAKGQNKGQCLELRADPALEGAQHPGAQIRGLGTQHAQDRPWHSI